MGLGFLSTVLLARVLSSSGYGVYIFVYAWIEVLSLIVQFGFPTLLIRETAQGMSRNRPDLVKGLWQWAGWITIFLSFLIAIIGLILIWLLRYITDELRSTFYWAIPLLPLIALGNLSGAALQGLRRVIAGQMTQFLIRPALLVLFVTAGYFIIPSFSAIKAMACNVGAAALAFIIGVGMLWRAIPISVRSTKPEFESWSWWISSLSFVLISAMHMLNEQISIIILGFYVSSDQVGIYSVADKLSGFASLGLQAVNIVIAPQFAALYTEGNMPKLQRLAKASASVSFFIYLAITIGYVVLGRLFIRTIFGVDYVDAYTLILILLAGQAVNCGVGSVGVLLNMTHNQRYSVSGLAVSVLVNIGLNFLLVPRLGNFGAALANALSLTTWNILLWLAVRRRLGIKSYALNLSER